MDVAPTFRRLLGSKEYEWFALFLVLFQAGVCSMYNFGISEAILDVLNLSILIIYILDSFLSIWAYGFTKFVNNNSCRWSFLLPYSKIFTVVDFLHFLSWFMLNSYWNVPSDVFKQTSNRFNLGVVVLSAGSFLISR